MSSSQISALLLLTLAVLRASSAPLTEPKYKILSLHSTSLVSYTPNGDVIAKTGDFNDPSTDFYQHTHDFPRVSYESVQYPGKFLLLDHKTGQIRVDVPEDNNEIFLQIGHPTLYGFYALKSHSNMDCYIAFDIFGSVPTNPGICDQELHHDRHTSLHVYQV